MASLLLLDNYDSFTWNLAQYLAELGAEVEVRMNDEVDAQWCAGRGFEAIVVSPGPGRPEAAGISLALIRVAAARRLPLLGVCLGHQALAQAWGASIVHAPSLMHGKTSPIVHDGLGLFAGLAPDFPATRYHSLTVDEATLDGSFRITARTPEGVIMGLEHRHLPLYGVQFHPESVLTLEGQRLLGNFLGLAREHHAALSRAPEGRA
jgi:anthranilate synthase/aminodeoxychorismate synthase-like glutamine amidotransferase